MTEDELSAFLEDNKEDILRASKDAILDKITATLSYQLPSFVTDEVTKFMRDEIAPAVADHLQSEKGAIVAAVKKAASEIGDELAKQMVAKAAANMTGYRSHDVFKSLFGH